MSPFPNDFTLEAFLLTRVMASNPDARGNMFVVKEAIASTAIEHPEWPPLDERRSWDEWLEWEQR